MDASKLVEALRRKYADASAEEMLAGFLQHEFPDRIAVASSFGAESAALLAMIARVEPATPILFLQTKVLFDETLQYAKDICATLGLTNLVYVEPDAVTLESEDPENSLWISNPDRCCFIRKVAPFRKALGNYDCWISGIKRAHGGARAEIQPIELEDGRIKLNPLFDQTAEDIERAFTELDLPRHPLTKFGYRSIGCMPCTRMATAEDDPRAGRWARGGKTECGIHSLLYARAKQQEEGSPMDAERHHSYYRRNWFITGACGTVGRELLRLVSTLDPQHVVAIDNNESELFFVKEEYRRDDRYSFFVTSLRDRNEIIARMAGAEIVLHAAALKHVILCEQSPMSAVNTNIIGTQSVIDAAQINGVERLLFTSSDKAVNPTNVMGTSKLMAERLVSAANAFARQGKQVFASTRFGNVLGSRGSVVPIFRRQIAAGGPITLTHDGMTRFIMTLSQAVKLVMDSVFLAKGGEVFVTKMPVVRIADLAQAMIDELAPQYGFKASDIGIEMIGSKAGEKLYEELMNEEEVRRSQELEDYFVITPALRSMYRDIDYVYPGTISSEQPSNPYNSKTATAMTQDEVRAYLRANPELLKD
ncbi:MAG TPA: phosphoadenylyl-sulfate reductase [Rhizomicrobium sp.]|nr:phosphoadenylyl-sulfate reductase [Rhizomicrobium sp.]